MDDKPQNSPLPTDFRATLDEIYGARLERVVHAAKRFVECVTGLIPT